MLPIGNVDRAGAVARWTRDGWSREATVKTYVGRLLRKLGLRNRTQAVVAAYDLGIVRPGHRDSSGERLLAWA